MPKQIQVEIPGAIPAPDGVGKAANKFREIIGNIEELTEEKGKAESALLSALKRAKRTSIKVEGYVFLLSHIGPKDKITVQKPRP